jgi:hypothetical protein
MPLLTGRQAYRALACLWTNVTCLQVGVNVEQDSRENQEIAVETRLEIMYFLFQEWEITPRRMFLANILKAEGPRSVRAFEQVFPDTYSPERTEEPNTYHSLYFHFHLASSWNKLNYFFDMVYDA